MKSITKFNCGDNAVGPPVDVTPPTFRINFISHKTLDLFEPNSHHNNLTNALTIAVAFET